MSRAKTFAKASLRRVGVDVRRMASSSRPPREEYVAPIRRALAVVPNALRYCVDIGASDGITASTSWHLINEGWGALVVEVNGFNVMKLARQHYRRPDVRIARVPVTPTNVVDLLRGFDIPERFGFLSLDIDGYDSFVLKELLAAFRPSVIFAEVNEKIPPPIRFSVLYTPNYLWPGGHFYGQSISTLADIAISAGYSLVELDWHNAILMPDELAPRSVSAEAAYRVGYAERSGRAARYPYNSDMDDLLTMNAIDAANTLRQRFATYEGQFNMSVPHKD